MDDRKHNVERPGRGGAALRRSVESLRRPRAPVVRSVVQPPAAVPLPQAGKGDANPGSKRRGGSHRDQLAAAAASVVWFAGWFQSIFDEVVGRDE